MERFSEVQSERALETQSIPGSLIVSPNIFVRIEVSRGPSQISSELFATGSVDVPNEMISTAHNIGDASQAQNETTTTENPVDTNNLFEEKSS